jgi:hypothetical protein
LTPLPHLAILALPNIKLSYLYRDGANYKNHNSIILNNPTNIALAEIETAIRSKLIDGAWFYVDKWNLPDLHFGTWDNETDHTWHEFDGIEFTDKTGSVDLLHFLRVIRD